MNFLIKLKKFLFELEKTITSINYICMDGWPIGKASDSNPEVWVSWVIVKFMVGSIPTPSPILKYENYMAEDIFLLWVLDICSLQLC